MSTAKSIETIAAGSSRDSTRSEKPKNTADKEMLKNHRAMKHTMKKEGVDIQSFLKTMLQKGEKGPQAQHQRIIRESPTISCFVKNTERNRYSDMILLDDTRVKLNRTNKNDTDYIHASKVFYPFHTEADEQKKAADLDKNGGRPTSSKRDAGSSVLDQQYYILCQAPMSSTNLEMWRMIWQEFVTVIVCLTPIDAKDESLDMNYWPRQKGKSLKFGGGRFKVKTLDLLDEHRDYNVYTLELRARNENEGGKAGSAVGEGKLRRIHLFHYVAWSGASRKMPPTESFIRFLELVAAQQKTYQSLYTEIQLPTVVHGLTGVRRSSTFTAVNICLRLLASDKARKERRIDVQDIVLALRRQRYGAFHSLKHYMGFNDIVVHWAVSVGLIGANDECYKAFVEQMIFFHDLNAEQRN